MAIADRNIGVRAAGPGDAEALLHIHRSAILVLGRDYYSQAETESWAANLTAAGYLRAMEQGGELFHVAFDDGGATVGFYGRKGNEVTALYVDPDRARRGIGTTLLVHAEQAIAADGHGRVRIGAALSGRGFYLARGYETECRADWETRGGLVLEACDMAKTLVPESA
ncbi:MAG: GNAT family N-acetyltransferase [Hyphomicrobiales bacterium]